MKLYFVFASREIIEPQDNHYVYYLKELGPAPEILFAISERELAVEHALKVTDRLTCVLERDFSILHSDKNNLISRLDYDVAHGIVPVPGVPLSGQVALIGFPLEGETLTVDTSQVDGNPPIDPLNYYEYQWSRGDSPVGAFQVLVGEVNSFYLCGIDDIGKFILVTIERPGYEGSLSSPSVGPIEPPVLMGTIALAGNTVNGELLMIVTDGISNAAAPFNYQWARADDPNDPPDQWEPIAGATTNEYFTQPADAGKYIFGIVSKSGFSGTVNSLPLGPIGPAA
jgi:hypothetical protein